MPANGAPAVPRATLRLQFSRDFTFDDAVPLVPYFAKLGISHLYASPILRARAGSTHGYDIIDHAHLNPELGGEEGFALLTDALAAHGMGLVVDFAPNHMGVGGGDNGWWLDVLEWGEASPFARFFDIDWISSDPAFRGKVLLPFLGDHYGAALERGELRLEWDAARGAFVACYHQHRFPLAPPSYAVILRDARQRLAEPSAEFDQIAQGFAQLAQGGHSVQKQALLRQDADGLRARLAQLAAEDAAVRAAIEGAVDRFDGRAGEPASFVPLHKLFEAQHWRLAFWRVAADEINYRRFFDVNDLAGLRIEEPELFELAHQLIFRLVAEGRLQGLRLDHVDGLRDPIDYVRKLQDRCALLLMQARAGAPQTDPEEPKLAQPFYVLVEKILAAHESLRDDWAVAGTTGYEFMNQVNGLFVDGDAESALDAAYARFVGRRVDFEEVAERAKRRIAQNDLASELNVLVQNLRRIALQNWRTRDYTTTGLRNALIDVVVGFPVYRTYIAPGAPIDDEDRRVLDWAFGRARKLSSAFDRSIFDFIYAVLSGDLARSGAPGYHADDLWRTLLKFQQYTGPVTAKAIEDTAFYRYHRLASLNEVGGEPTRFGVSPAAFHRLNQDRQRRFPHAMLATATHDAKRGEDVRARIDVLSEIPAEWTREVRRWARLNRFKKRAIGGQSSPAADDEYLFYQNLLGVWPLGLSPDDRDGLDDLAERMAGYMLKALREGKQRSSWTAPDEDYEQALTAFVRGALDPTRSRPFLVALRDFAERVAPAAAVNGLAQTLLKATAPGVPDFYQGTEYWQFDLVDPDNRRRVDFAARQGSLDEALLERDPARRDLSPMLDHWRDGRVKQHLIALALDLRHRQPALFAQGDYQALETEGAQGRRLVAFARRWRDAAIVVVAPRLVLPMLDGVDRPLPQGWGDSAAALPEALRNFIWRDWLTGRRIEATGDGRLAAEETLARFPVALLVAEPR